MNISVTYSFGGPAYREIHHASFNAPDNWDELKSHEQDAWVSEKFNDYLDWSYEVEREGAGE